MASPELACKKNQSVLNAADVQVESYWIDPFSEYFKKHDITELIKGTSLGCSPSPTSISRNIEPEMTIDNQTNKKEEEEEEIPGGFDDLFG